MFESCRGRYRDSPKNRSNKEFFALLWMDLVFPLGPYGMLMMQSGGAREARREARSTTRGLDQRPVPAAIVAAAVPVTYRRHMTNNEIEILWHPDLDKARRAWWLSAEKSGNWKVALRPDPKWSGVQIVDTEHGAIVGWVPKDLAPEWYPKVSAYVKRHKVCPLVDSHREQGMFIDWPPNLNAPAVSSEGSNITDDSGGLLARLRRRRDA